MSSYNFESNTFTLSEQFFFQRKKTYKKARLDLSTVFAHLGNIHASLTRDTLYVKRLDAMEESERDEKNIIKNFRRIRCPFSLF